MNKTDKITKKELVILQNDLTLFEDIVQFLEQQEKELEQKLSKVKTKKWQTISEIIDLKFDIEKLQEFQNKYSEKE